MEKIFRTFDELFEFDLSELEPQKSNYLGIILANGLPRIKMKQGWKFRGKDHSLVPKIIFEITPRWLTINIHRGEGKEKRQLDIECLRKNPKVLIQEVFDI